MGAGFFWGGTSFGTHPISVPAMTKSSSASFAGLSFHSYSIFFLLLPCYLRINGTDPKISINRTELRDSFLLNIGRCAAPCTVHFNLFFPQKNVGSMMFILLAKCINLDVPIFNALLVVEHSKQQKAKKTTCILDCDYCL